MQKRSGRVKKKEPMATGADGLLARRSVGTAQRSLPSVHRRRPVTIRYRCMVARSAPSTTALTAPGAKTRAGQSALGSALLASVLPFVMLG